MEKAARRFMTWVLGLHLLVLALLVVIVVYASTEVYSNTRRQALDQVRVRQELLAAQSARGIEQFYRSILDQLEIQGRAGTDSRAHALFWEQLRGRAVRLFEVEGQSLERVTSDYGEDDRASAAEVVNQARADLVGLKAAKVTDTYNFGGTLATLVAMPVEAAREPRIIVAVIPARAIETRFLNDLNAPENISSLLFDRKLQIVSAKNRALVGSNLSQIEDKRVTLVAMEYIEKGAAGTREFLEPVKIGSVALPPAMVSMQPIDLAGGRKWWMTVASGLSEVDTAVGQFFRRAFIGAGLVILAMTGVLVSTSTQMIRGRLRLERLQREMLSRELEQARDIQLLWLPERQGAQIGIDVAAVNRPASHVSGDFYNWFEMPDGRACVVIGDVTGHGLPAAFLMATAQLLVRTIITRVADPGRCLRECNSQLCTHVFSGQFVTLLVCVIDPERQTIELATAGHPPPLVGSGGEFTPLPVEPQLVMAVDQEVAYRTQRFTLPPGASLLLYTDGVTDVQAPTGERLGPEAVEKSLYGSFDRAQTLLDAVLDVVDTFRAGRESSDDLTLVAIQLPDQPAPAPAPSPDANSLTLPSV